MDVFATFIRPYEKIKTDMTGIIINKGGRAKYEQGSNLWCIIMQTISFIRYGRKLGN